ncbi:glycosyltransferase family 2 protein [Streptomyces aidingensis]|uniref:Glycosyltransferase, GT2 family n=1 Tax=Streptomyces aidingensis TaxID=910347 RepID=A0A1I1LA26_9ACTN|nr:glycosyltransferase [Streptomyces aidingensis]SFC69372.1 Glycosyltransferase, GT2 family [Streptomyces aidingensis]
MSEPSVNTSAPDRGPGVVIATRDRAEKLAGTLRRLTALPERPRIVVVDNASSDGTRAMVTRRFPQVQLVPLHTNRGALARNDGVRAVGTEYVAFSDDDSWWEPGALAAAGELLVRQPRIGLLAARTLVGPDGAAAEDPLNAVLAASPLRPPPGPGPGPGPGPDRGAAGVGAGGLPGPPVLGFLGCAAVVRREAFLAVGGYHPVLFFGAEETLLAYDLTAAGWLCCYAPAVTARHRPADVPRPHRKALTRRNATLTAWLRRPLPVALRRTGELALAAPGDPVARRALGGLLPRLPAALCHRRRLPPAVEADVRRLEQRRPEAPPEGRRTSVGAGP